MRVLTLFLAYQETVERKAMAMGFRDKGRTGIAINDDFLALKWQRYNRLSYKLGMKIIKRLSEMEK